MATINTPNDPNRNVTTANAAPQQQNPANTGVQTPSGQFSTLQKYLGANKNAGQRIGGLIGGNLTNESTQQKDTTQRELGESGQANQNFSNLTGQTQGFTQQLSQPAQGVNSVNGKAYDANSYQTNLSGQQAAQNIAKDVNQLNTFTGIRSGDTAAKQKAESDKQAQESLQAAQRAYDTNKQRQSQLVNNQGRDQLISQALNTQNQRAGLRNLDNAFLTQDKTGTLNNLSNNLRQNVGALQQNVGQGQQQSNAVTGLNAAQQTAQTSLVDRLGSMQKEYDDVLQSRIGSINQSKDLRTKQLEDEFAKLQGGKEINEKFAEMLQLQNVTGSKAIDPNIVDNNMGMNTNPYQNVRLFNTLKDQNLNNFLDTNLLREKAMTSGDVANQADIEALNNLASLSGRTNNINQASKFVGDQVGESSLDEALNQRANKFLTDDLTKTFTGSGYKQEDIGGSSAMARAYSSAAASLNDVLNGNIYRNTQGSQSKGWENSLGPALAGIATGGNLGIPFAANQDVREGVDSAIRGAIQGGTNIIPGLAVGVNPQISNAVGGYLRNLQGTMRGAGLTADGGLQGRNIGNGEWGRSMNYADAQSVGQVNDQAQQYIKDIGYNNLLKIAKGDF